MVACDRNGDSASTAESDEVQVEVETSGNSELCEVCDTEFVTKTVTVTITVTPPPICQQNLKPWNKNMNKLCLIGKKHK